MTGAPGVSVAVGGSGVSVEVGGTGVSVSVGGRAVLVAVGGTGVLVAVGGREVLVLVGVREEVRLAVAVLEGGSDVEAKTVFVAVGRCAVAGRLVGAFVIVAGEMITGVLEAVSFATRVALAVTCADVAVEPGRCGVLLASGTGVLNSTGGGGVIEPRSRSIIAVETKNSGMSVRMGASFKVSS